MIHKKFMILAATLAVSITNISAAETEDAASYDFSRGIPSTFSLYDRDGNEHVGLARERQRIDRHQIAGDGDGIHDIGTVTL